MTASNRASALDSNSSSCRKRLRRRRVYSRGNRRSTRGVSGSEGNCCHTLAGGRSRMSYAPIVQVRNVTRLLLSLLAHRPENPAAVSARLTEWKVELSQGTIAAGTVTFTVTNAGSIPHALEVEGQGIEQETGVIQPGASATLTLTLKPGTYEVYCPVGNDSHKKLGMDAELKVAPATGATASDYNGAGSMAGMGAPAPSIQAIRVTGGGPVIQILPGPFPFPDS